MALTKAERQEQSRQALEARRRREAEAPPPVKAFDELAGICEEMAEILGHITTNPSAARLVLNLKERISKFRYDTDYE